VLPADVVERLQAALDDDPNLELVVDVEARRFAAPALGIDEPFTLDDFTQHRLLEGLDDIGITLTHESDIASYETRRPTWSPTVAP
jgi:3-isopropylmalate/(R)-2-methylmalate dehydratase small subunit